MRAGNELRTSRSQSALLVNSREQVSCLGFLCVGWQAMNHQWGPERVLGAAWETDWNRLRERV